MFLTDKQKSIIRDLLSKRAELKEKLSVNIKEATRLRNMMKNEKNQRNYWLMFDSVKKGERLIAEQTKSCNQLSIQKISTKININYATVKKHEAMLERDVRESLGIA